VAIRACLKYSNKTPHLFSPSPNHFYHFPSLHTKTLSLSLFFPILSQIPNKSFSFNNCWQNPFTKKEEEGCWNLVVTLSLDILPILLHTCTQFNSERKIYNQWGGHYEDCFIFFFFWEKRGGHCLCSNRENKVIIIIS
jgi:hypothetical protein